MTENFEPSTDMLVLLNEQSDNFPALKAFVTSNRITPAIVFLPQTLSQLDHQFNTNQDLLFDCLNYLDIVKLYSLTVYGGGETFLNEVIANIANTRFNQFLELTLGQTALDDFMFKDWSEAVKFCKNNLPIVAIYLYSLITLMFYNSNN